MPEALLFSCEFCEIFKNTFFTEHLLVTVSGPALFSLSWLCDLLDYTCNFRKDNSNYVKSDSFFLIFIQSFSNYGKSCHRGIFCYCFCSILDLSSVQRLVYILNFKLVKSLSQVLLL